MSLLTKYRPNNWDEIFGQEKVVDALEACIKRERAYLLIGPSGTGKTTLARIAAKQVGAAGVDLIEQNAADKTGVDDMRGVFEHTRYRPISGKNKAVIIDEAHRLSPQAWDSSLKEIEEAPWTYWFFCSTVIGKIPKAIQTRCVKLTLVPVPRADMEDLLDQVVKWEKLKLPAGVIDTIVRYAEGSPRQALAYLALCSKVKTRAEASQLILGESEENAPAFKLAQALFNGADWGEVQSIISKFDETVTAEGVRRIVLNYGAKKMLGTTKESVAGKTLEVMDHFSDQFDASLGMTPLLIACGKLVL